MRTMIVTAMVCSAAIPAFGHHSVAMFDQEQVITIDGVMKELQMVRPHGWFHITATDDAGRAMQWSFEMQGVRRLEPPGFEPSMFEPGTAVTVFAHPSKDGSRSGQFLGVRLPDGTEFRYPAFTPQRR